MKYDPTLGAPVYPYVKLNAHDIGQHWTIYSTLSLLSVPIIIGLQKTGVFFEFNDYFSDFIFVILLLEQLVILGLLQKHIKVIKKLKNRYKKECRIYKKFDKQAKKEARIQQLLGTNSTTC